MLSTADELLKTDAIFEVKTGSIARGRKKIPYLPPVIVKRIVENGGRFILSSDAHKVEHLGFGFDNGLEYLKSLGVRDIVVWQKGGVKSVKI
jgi:histidinol phosphatase-like PHP family hydrolase